MIILRQAEYSLSMTRKLVGVNRILGKSPMKAKRKALKQEKKILGGAAKVVNKVQKTKQGLEEIALNPGKAVARGTEAIIRHPISATSQVAGKATMVIDPTGIGLAPIGAVGTGGELALRKYVPKYAKATDKLGDKFVKSKAPKYIEEGSNAILRTIRSVTG